jgi:hypothetical protein
MLKITTHNTLFNIELDFLCLNTMSNSGKIDKKTIIPNLQSGEEIAKKKTFYQPKTWFKLGA